MHRFFDCRFLNEEAAMNWTGGGRNRFRIGSYQKEDQGEYYQRELGSLLSVGIS